MASAPEKTLRRILLVSAIDGWSIALFAGLCTLVSLFLGEWIGVLVGGLVTAGGVLEVRGRAALIRGESAGISGLVRAQTLILVTIWIYALLNLITYDEAAIMAQFTPELRSALSQAGMSVEDLRPMMKPAFFGFYLVVMGVTLLFQGGLALYYRSRRPAVAAALEARGAAPSEPPAA